MERKITVSFLEREFLDADRSGKTVRGFEPAYRIKDGKTEFGRVIDVKRLQELGFVDYCLFQTTLDFKDSVVDLNDILKNDENGMTWLNAHKKYFLETFNDEVPMNLSITNEPMPILEYSALPEDYLKRTENGRQYYYPRGLLSKLPETSAYTVIHPPMKFKNGKWIPNVYYNRTAFMSDGSKWSYSAKKAGDKDSFNARGVILGELMGKDIEQKSGEFKGSFPIKHTLEVVYPILLRQAGKYKPLSINFQIVN